MSILIFLFILFMLVLVHEWGHFIVAKKTGMRVDEFGIGFPPKLYGIKKGETEYTINALPLGGFVKIYGEDGLGEASKDAGITLNQERSFTGKSRWAQAAVLVAGVSMNVLFAWFLFSAAFMYGVQEAVDETTATGNAKLIITDVLKNGPAEKAALVPGAVIKTVKAGDTALTTLTPKTFTEFIGAHTGATVEVVYMKGSELMVASIVPEMHILPSDPDRPAIGIALTLVDTVRRPFFTALSEGFTHTFVSLKNIAVGLAVLARDAVVGKADLSQVAGPVGIVGLVGEASVFGIASLLMFTGFISLNLAVINLLPFPALDGGRLLFVILEGVFKRPIPARANQIMNTVGFAILILLMVIVTWNDISKLI